MGYYVLGDQGQKYGPADVDTLNLWVTEGRIVPHSMLEDEVSGGQIVASSIRGLQFPMIAPPSASPAPPYAQTPQYRPQSYVMPTTVDHGPIVLAFAMAVVSPMLSYFISFGGLITAGIGLRSALRAKNNGHPLATLAIVACALAMGFWVLSKFARFY
ncbi:MAG: hypothetical protein P4L46_20500 [Fimbriimonas sp.]|nr:hypothetical protein [Fimbriimonas sp.]